VKTRISFAANLFGAAEEEHAGGALAFQRFNHGEEFGVGSLTREPGYDFDDMTYHYGAMMNIQPEGYAIEKRFPDIIYVPQDQRMNLNSQKITLLKNGQTHAIRLRPGKIYILITRLLGSYPASEGPCRFMTNCLRRRKSMIQQITNPVLQVVLETTVTPLRVFRSVIFNLF